MNKKFLLLLLSPLLINWGGFAPTNWGMNENQPSFDDVPFTTTGNMYWYAYNGGVNQDNWDYTAFAIASLDKELDFMRFIHTTSDPPVFSDGATVAISFKPLTDPVPVECTDNIDGGCTLATTQCLSSIRSGIYDYCTFYRIIVHTGRVYADAIVDGEDPNDIFFNVVRHEFVHALGFDHSDGGPMSKGSNPLTQCQKDKLQVFQMSESQAVWQYIKPASCPD